MASLDSDAVRTALTRKLGCKEEKDSDHIRFVLRDTNNKILSRTMISHGSKHVITDNLINKMTRQIKLGTNNNFVRMVQCSLTAEDCLRIIRDACK